MQPQFQVTSSSWAVRRTCPVLAAFRPSLLSGWRRHRWFTFTSRHSITGVPHFRPSAPNSSELTVFLLSNDVDEWPAASTWHHNQVKESSVYRIMETDSYDCGAIQGTDYIVRSCILPSTWMEVNSFLTRCWNKPDFKRFTQTFEKTEKDKN